MFSHVIGHELALDTRLFAVIKYLPKATSGRKATIWLSVPGKMCGPSWQGHWRQEQEEETVHIVSTVGNQRMTARACPFSSLV